MKMDWLSKRTLIAKRQKQECMDGWISGANVHKSHEFYSINRIWFLPTLVVGFWFMTNV
jgi:hypothetical protein